MGGGGGGGGFQLNVTMTLFWKKIVWRCPLMSVQDFCEFWGDFSDFYSHHQQTV